MAKTRTFIAIEAVDEVHARAQQAIDTLRSAGDDVKWVAPENLHWTLQFLGDITDESMAAVCRLTAKIAASYEPFTLTAQGVGAFPKPERPRTLWLGAGEGREPLCELQDELEEAMCELGFRGENRRFVPHLTLGRLGRFSKATPDLIKRLDDLSDFEGGTMAVDEVTVYASELQKSGPVYHILSTAALGD